MCMEEFDPFAVEKETDALMISETVSCISMKHEPSTSLYTLPFFISAGGLYELEHLWIWQHPWLTPLPFPRC